MDAHLSIIYVIFVFEIYFIYLIFSYIYIYIYVFIFFIIVTWLDKSQIFGFRCLKAKEIWFWASTAPGRSYNVNTRVKGIAKRECTVRTIHTGIDSGCRKIRSKRADWRAKRTACRTRKSERTRENERFKIEKVIWERKPATRRIGDITESARSTQ